MKFRFERELTAVEADHAHTTWEYEVAVDCHIAGEVDYGPFRFSVWDLGVRQIGSERFLCFRVPAADNRHQAEGEAVTEVPVVYHGGTEVDEIASLFSLAARRRFRVGRITRMDDVPRRFAFDNPIHPALYNDASSLNELSPILSHACALKDEFKQRFSLAVRLYALALNLIENQTDQAFLNLISSIEALSATYEMQDGTAYVFGEPVDTLLAQIGDDALAERLKKELWKTSRATRKFVAFILDHVEEHFWASPERPVEEFLRIKSEDLGQLLKRIYAARSNLLHSGEPVCPTMSKNTTMGEEMSFALSIGMGDRVWEPKDYVPHIGFIERLVQHVLMNFLFRNRAI